MNSMDWLAELQTISGYSSWTKITPITKGWSEETKFRVENSSSDYYLIRITDKSNFEQKKQEFHALKQLSLTNLNISQPVDFGLTSSGDWVYTIFTWVKGNDAEIEIPKLSPSQQYKFGRKAGLMLREIHKFPAPLGVPEWGPRFNQKIESRIKSYQEMGIKLNHDQNVIQFLRENVKLLYNRPQTLQHGDFHLGNMVISQDPNIKSKELGLVDFNRLSYGDPWEEFERCFFTIQKSIPFMNGQIHSYFDDDVPDLFLRLLAFYTGYSCIASIPWAKPAGHQEIDNSRKLSNIVIEGFSNYQDYIPKWYQDPQ
jgi:aminoglycoside phosphotransferase (APT) family kinase protein